MKILKIKFNMTGVNNFKILTSLILILLFTVSARDSYTQNFVSMYEEFIPSSILDNPQLKTTINIRLAEKAKIHPELIFYNIEIFRNLDSKKIPQDILNNFVYQKQKNYLLRRNDWAVEQITALNQSQVSLNIKTECTNYFTELMYDSLDNLSGIEDTILFDQNLIDFVVYKYITKDLALVYDSETNYQFLRVSAQHLLLKEYKGIYNSLNNSNEISIESFIETLLKNWYIFADTNIKSDKVEEYPDFYQIINKLIEFKTSTKRQPSFTFNIGYSFYNATYNITNTLPVIFTEYPSYSKLFETYNDPMIDIDLSVPQLIGTFSYRIFIKNYIEFLSYINLQLMVSFGVRENKKTELNKSTQKNKIGTVDISRYEYLEWESELKNVNSYMLKIGIPVVVIGNSIFFELNLNTGLIKYSSTTTYSYYMSKTEGYTAGSFWEPYYYSHLIAKGIGKGNIDTNENDFIIYPTLDIFYETEFGLRFTASSSYNYAAVFCGYSF